MDSQEKPPLTFVYYLALAYLAATLLTSGLGHTLGLGRFRDLMKEHTIVPAGLAMTIAFVIAAFELVAGSLLLTLLVKETATVSASILFGMCGIAGGAFASYINRLLHNPDRMTSCGCSPLEGPLTSVSLVPAFALILTSCFGLLATGLGFGGPVDGTYGVIGISVALPLAWGVTLALIIILLPASMPRAEINER